MLTNKKIEIIYCKNDFFPNKIGYSLGTVYRKDFDNCNHIKLLNFGYCPLLKTFYYNNHVHLPKVIIECFESLWFCEKNTKAIEEFGIYDIDDIDKLIEEYKHAKVQVELEKERIMNFKRTLRIKQNKNNK